MPKSKSVESAKSRLDDELRALCKDHEGIPVLIPSLRDLSVKHGLSKSLTQRVVRGLCNEGLLYPVHGMGTFAGGRPQVERIFLFLDPQGGDRDAQIRAGFETRMSALGAVTLAIPLGEAARQREKGLLPEIQGMWDPSFDYVTQKNLAVPEGVPYVGVAGRVESGRGIEIGFDEQAGGRLATTHMLHGGARKLTLLGVHSPSAPPGALDWSRMRAEGFWEAVQSVGVETDAREILPKELLFVDRPNDPFDYFEMGREMGMAFELERELEAVVAVNDRVAYGFLLALVERDIPVENVPPIIGFDSQECRVGTYLSSIVLPWYDLGRVAADTLFAMVNRPETKSTSGERVSMGQLTRMSSRPGWLAQAPALKDALRTALGEADLLG